MSWRARKFLDGNNFPSGASTRPATLREKWSLPRESYGRPDGNTVFNLIHKTLEFLVRSNGSLGEFLLG